MLFKTDKSRVDDALKYITVDCGYPSLANHVRKVLRDNGGVDKLTKLVGTNLSIGARPGPKGNGYDEETRKRRALRALLLLQAVYLGPMWKKASGASWDSTTCLVANWKQVSLDHWQPKSVHSINQGISCYVRRTGLSKTLLADSFVGSPPVSEFVEYLFNTRERDTFGGFGICYSSIMFWMYKRGFVSYPWYLAYSGGAFEPVLSAAFGTPAETLWQGQFFTAQDALPPVPRGMIVHMWNPDNYNWNGHWLVSNGGDSATGCNNGQEPNRVIVGVYDQNCRISGQFLGYNIAKPNQPVQKGLLTIYDPMKLPDVLGA